MYIVVTGGIGYIGSHTVYELYKSGYEPIIIDNLINSTESRIENLKKLIKSDFKKDILFYNIDLCDEQAVLKLANEYNGKIRGIIHFAALKNVGESNIQPFKFYNNNLKSLLNILQFAKEVNCPNFIFSSSATVYPHSTLSPIRETTRDNMPIASANNSKKHKTIVTGSSPYGITKIMAEQVLHDISYSDPFWNIIILRYFNPVGYHKSGLLGEEILNYPTQQNLFPTILINKKYGKVIQVFGDDYNTPDGTAIRDYIHIEDLAYAHIKALEYSEKNKGLDVFNIGVGKGYSVKEIIQGFAKKGFTIKYNIVGRREGDAEKIYADSTKAINSLEWKPIFNLDDMIQSTIDYYDKNNVDNNVDNIC
jgi:UDP-glucose 4-epimerase